MGHSILIVEDDESFREMLEDFLQLEGYEVTSTAGADEALGWLAAGRAPDLILTDLRMPEGDGQLLSTRVREDPRLTAVRILMISGRVPEWSLDGTVDGFLLKPIDADLLLRTVARFCCRGGARSPGTECERCSEPPPGELPCAVRGPEVRGPLA